MSEIIFWVWNGWGLLFVGIIALSKFLYIFLTITMGPTPLRKPLTLVNLIAIVLSFIFSGWVVGILAYPIGWIGGVMLGRLFVLSTEGLK